MRSAKKNRIKQQPARKKISPDISSMMNRSENKRRRYAESRQKNMCETAACMKQKSCCPEPGADLEKIKISPETGHPLLEFPIASGQQFFFRK